MYQEKIHKIVARSLFYPSGENCQPFHFTINEDSLDIHFDQNRADHELDFLFIASYITLGCLLKLLEESAASEGLKILVKLGPGPSPTAKVEFSASTKSLVDELIPFIKSRRTYRGRYQKCPLPQRFLEEFLPRKNLLITQDISREIKEVLGDFDQEFWKNKFVVKNLLSSIHFSEKSYKKHSSGFYHPELFLRFDEVLSMRFFKLFPALISFLVPFGIGLILKKRFLSQLENSSLVVFLIDSSEVNDPKRLLPGLVEVGVLAMEFWLKATQYGLYGQPLSIGAFATFYTQKELMVHASGVPRFDLKNMARKTKELEELLHIPQGKSIAWLMRLGTPHERDLQLLKTLPRQRLSLEKLQSKITL